MNERTSPPPELRYRRPLQFGVFLRELWRARHLVRTLTERDLRARYKQAMLGFAWAFVGPIGYVIVFSLFFERVADVNTRGTPYVLFSYVALVPWGFFAGAVIAGSNAVIGNLVLVNKVACPREVFPLAAVLTAFVDAAITALALPVLFVVTGYMPKITVLWLPVVLVVQLAFTLGLVLLLAGVVMYVRDVRHGLPILMQMALFATPIAYGLGAIPQSMHRLYALLNPMAPVVDAYRRTILYGTAPDWSLLGLAAVTSTVLLVGGYALFKRLEPGFADVA